MLIGYARVSTQDQNTDMQLDALRAAGCEKLFQEKASSGKQLPELEAAIGAAQRGDTLVVWRLDRLARSLKKLIGIVDDLAGRGIGFRSLNEQIDTTNATGQLVFHVFGALAEFERSLTRDRTKAGLAAAKQRGRRLGRPPALDAIKLTAAKAMLRDPNLSVREIAAQLGVATSTLYLHIPGAKAFAGADQLTEDA